MRPMPVFFIASLLALASLAHANQLATCADALEYDEIVLLHEAVFSATTQRAVQNHRLMPTFFSNRVYRDFMAVIRGEDNDFGLRLAEALQEQVPTLPRPVINAILPEFALSNMYFVGAHQGDFSGIVDPGYALQFLATFPGLGMIIASWLERAGKAPAWDVPPELLPIGIAAAAAPWVIGWFARVRQVSGVKKRALETMTTMMAGEIE